MNNTVVSKVGTIQEQSPIKHENVATNIPLAILVGIGCAGATSGVGFSRSASFNAGYISKHLKIDLGTSEPPCIA